IDPTCLSSTKLFYERIQLHMMLAGIGGHRPRGLDLRVMDPPSRQFHAGDVAVAAEEIDKLECHEILDHLIGQTPMRVDTENRPTHGGAPLRRQYNRNDATSVWPRFPVGHRSDPALLCRSAGL